MSALKFTAAMAILLCTAACGDTWGQRAVTGGAIGAGSGAVIGAVDGHRRAAGRPGGRCGRRRRRRRDHAGALIPARTYVWQPTQLSYLRQSAC